MTYKHISYNLVIIIIRSFTQLHYARTLFPDLKVKFRRKPFRSKLIVNNSKELRFMKIEDKKKTNI